MYSIYPCLLLTISVLSPPMRFFDGWSFNVRMWHKFLVQVRAATLGLAGQEEVGQAAQTWHGDDVLPSLPEAVEDFLVGHAILSKTVMTIQVTDGNGQFLTPAWVFKLWQEFDGFLLGKGTVHLFQLCICFKENLMYQWIIHCYMYCDLW